MPQPSDPDLLAFADAIGGAPQISAVVMEARQSLVNPADNFDRDAVVWTPFKPDVAPPSYGFTPT